MYPILRLITTAGPSIHVKLAMTFTLMDTDNDRRHILLDVSLLVYGEQFLHANVSWSLLKCVSLSSYLVYFYVWLLEFVIYMIVFGKLFNQSEKSLLE